jgi:hypothetical protein
MRRICEIMVAWLPEYALLALTRTMNVADSAGLVYPPSATSAATIGAHGRRRNHPVINASENDPSAAMGLAAHRRRHLE